MDGASLTNLRNRFRIYKKMIKKATARACCGADIFVRQLGN
jgi:hypothetical protein